MASFKKNIFLITTVTLITLSISQNCVAGNPLKEIFIAPGSKVAGGAANEGKDLTPFLKPGKCDKHYPWHYPLISDPVVTKKSLFVCQQNYALQYDTELKVPLWTSEYLYQYNFNSSFTFNDIKYKLHEGLPSTLQAIPKDYDNTGYSMLQLADPNNQRVFFDTYTKEKLEPLNKELVQEAFMTINTVPAHPTLKTGVWGELEQYVRQILVKEPTLMVTTGVIYENKKSLGNIGEIKIAIPTHFFKLITTPHKHGSVAFIIPNKEILHINNKKVINPKTAISCEGGPCNINNFIVSVANLEKVSGIYFYANANKYDAVQIKQNLNEYYRK